LGRQPIYRYHVREYTMEEVLALVEEAGFDVYNVASQDWITVDEVADEVVKAMDLRGVRKVYRPVLHGVGWLGDVKRVALRIDKLKTLGFKPSMNSREAIRATAKKLAEELSCSSQSP
jgi:UDP-glucose 4-epimerase